MPIYTAPVRDTRFVLDHVRRDRPLFEPAGLRQRDARPGRGDPDGGRPLLRGSAAAAQPRRRRGRLQAQRRRIGDHAAGLQGGLGPVRAPAAGRRCRRRRNMAGRGCRRSSATAIAEYLCSANHSFEMYNGLTQGAIAVAAGQGHPTSRRRNICPTWSPAGGPAR